MATYEDNLLQCPYVSSHQIGRGMSIQTHLRKCRLESLRNRNSPFYKIAINLQVCKYNASHHIHKDKMQNHLLNECDDAKRAVSQTESFNVFGSDSEDEDSLPEWKRKQLAMEKQEKRRHRVDHSSSAGLKEKEGFVPYDPQKKIEQSQNVILTQPMNRPKSERSEMRRQNILRNNEFVERSKTTHQPNSVPEKNRAAQGEGAAFDPHQKKSIGQSSQNFSDPVADGLSDSMNDVSIGRRRAGKRKK